MEEPVIEDVAADDREENEEEAGESRGRASLDSAIRRDSWLVWMEWRGRRSSEDVRTVHGSAGLQSAVWRRSRNTATSLEESWRGGRGVAALQRRSSSTQSRSGA